MRSRKQQWSERDDGDGYGDAAQYGYHEDEQFAGGPAGYGDDGYYPEDEERGLILEPEQSLVGVSNTVTQHGAPLLSYTRTMQRFYTSRKQRLSLGRHTCEVCGERIRFWAWQTPTRSYTHDGCYERLAWTWTNLYAVQQRLATQGQFE
jgi:hypothetical protein